MVDRKDLLAKKPLQFYRGSMTTPTPPAGGVRVTDARALRALAHPLRTRLLGLLRLDGPATATALGERVGESSGSTSYHLRELARYGFVIDAPELGTGRERWWQAAHRSTSWRNSDFSGPDAAVADELVVRLVELRGRALSAWLEQKSTMTPEWSPVSSLNDLPLHLTPAEASELGDELAAVLVRWRDERGHPPGTEGTGLVQAFTEVFPLTEYPL